MARTAIPGVTKVQIQNATYTYAADAEASDAYAIELASVPSAYVEGQSFTFKANTPNTGASSLNVNSLGAKTLKKLTDQDTVTGDIESGSIVEVVYDGTNFQITTVSAASGDHGTLLGLADDDHTQYALLAGRAGGQTVIGGTASGEDLTLQSTSNATKGSIFLGAAGTSAYDEVNDRLGIGVTNPAELLEVNGGAGPGTIRIQGGANQDAQLQLFGDRNWFIQNDANASLGTADYLHIVDSTAGSSRLAIDTNGNVGIGNTAPTHKLEVTGGVGLQRTVLAKTTDYTVLTTDSNTFFTNEGAAGTVIFTLPTAAAGLTYEFYIQAAQTLTVTANTGDTIRNAGTVTSSGGTFSDNTVGNLIRITAINATEWIVQSITGTWTTT